MTFRGFLTRAEVGLASPRSRSTAIAPEGTLLHWTGFRTNVTSLGDATALWRRIQQDAFDKDWVDVPYSTAGWGGYVLAGRGRGVRTAANGTNDANYRYHAHCILQGPDDELTQDDIDGWWWAWRHLGGGHYDGHRSVKATECPGDGPMRWIDAGPGTSGGTMVAAHDHTLTSLPRWAERGWKAVVDDGVFNQSTFGRIVHRATLGVFYAEQVRPLKVDVSELEKQVNTLKRQVKTLQEAAVHEIAGEVPEHKHESGKVIR